MQKADLHLGLFLILAVSTSLSCSKQSATSSPRSEQTNASQPAQSSTATLADSSPSVQLLRATEQKSPPTPPDPKEVGSAVARVFDKVATPQPAVVVGDFNGDGSQDLAVVIKSDSKSLPDLNNELANWILEDPRTVDTGTKRKPPQKPIQATQGDSLLAIIHGVGSDGWRNPNAKQAFVLKNGVGKTMLPVKATELRATKDKKQPALRGDAIRENVAGQEGLIYWTGAKYAWYSPGL